jgi:hypothetical protein
LQTLASSLAQSIALHAWHQGDVIGTLINDFDWLFMVSAHDSPYAAIPAGWGAGRLHGGLLLKAYVFLKKPLSSPSGFNDPRKSTCFTRRPVLNRFPEISRNLDTVAHGVFLHLIR